MLEAEFATATILISYGGILGVASPVQVIIMSILEIVFYNVRCIIFQIKKILRQNFFHHFR